MSFSESSAARRRIFAQISLALSSRTSEPSQMMRSFSSLSKTLVATRGSAMFTPVSGGRADESTGASRATRPCSPWAEKGADAAASTPSLDRACATLLLLRSLLRGLLVGLRGLLGLFGVDDRVGVGRGIRDLLRLFDDLVLVLGLVVDGDEAGQVDGCAVGVHHGDLAERDGESLVARDLADDGGQLVVLLQRVDELLRGHAVLGGRLHEVLRELVLRDLHVELLGDRVEQHLRAELLLACLGDLGAVHVVFETAFALEV